MALHRRRAAPLSSPSPEHADANSNSTNNNNMQVGHSTDTDIQQQLRFQSVYPSMVTAGGIQTAVVCSGSLNMRACKVLWKPALFQLVATTTAPSHANTIDVDQDAEEEESKEDDDDDASAKDKATEDGGKRGSLRYSLVFFQRGLLGRPRRKRIDLSDGSVRFRWSKDGRLLNTRFEFSLDYFAASNGGDHVVAKTLTCRASNATEYLAWTSALRAATEYAAEQWRLQSLSRLTLGVEQQRQEIKAPTSPTSPVQRQRVSVLSIEDSTVVNTKPEQQSRPVAQPHRSQPERQVNRPRRVSVSKRRVPPTVTKSALSSSKKPAAVKQLPPFRERRRGSVAKPSNGSSSVSVAASNSIVQSKKMAMAPTPLFPSVFDSNNSARCLLTTANSFAETKSVPMLGSNRSVASSSFVSSTRTRRRLRSRVGLSSFSRHRNNHKRQHRRGSAAKPASMAKMVRIRAVDSPFSASAVELSTRNALASSRTPIRPKSEAVGCISGDVTAPLCLFHPYRSAAQPKRPANITRRRVRAETNALDALLLGSQRSSTSERDDSGRDEAHAHLASSSAQVNAKRACRRAPVASMREYLASAHQSVAGGCTNSHNVSIASGASVHDVNTSDESLPLTRTTEYIDYLVMVAELCAGQSQSQTQLSSHSIDSDQEQRVRSRSSAPAVLTHEDALFLTARSALDLDAGDFSDSDDDDESSEMDEDSRRQAWRAYLSSFETEL